MKNEIRKGKRVQVLCKDTWWGEFGEVVKVERDAYLPVQVKKDGTIRFFFKDELRVISKRK